MKEQNDMDQFLRASLEAFKPAPDPSGKEKFLEEAATVIGRRGFFQSWRFLAVAALLVSLTGMITYYYSGDSTHDINNDTSSVNAGAPLTETSGSAAAGTDIPEPEYNLAYRDSVPESNRQFQDDPILTREGEMSSQKTFEMTSQERTSASPSLSVVEPAKTDSMNPVAETTEEIPLPLANTTGGSAVADSTIIEANLPGDDDYHDPGRRHLSYSAFYRADLMFNIIDNNKLVHALGAEIQYHFPDRRFLLRTGVGMSFSKGYNEYIVNYNEYLGSYLRLDSITFELAPNNFNLVSQLHQSEQTVYDTTVQALPSKVYQKYYYMQLPLVAGYDLITGKNLSFGIRAGTIFSLLMNKKPAEMNYDPGENLVVGIDNTTPGRITTNWQVTAGLNFTLSGPKKTFFEIEPAFSYYFKAMHQEAEDAKNPYSIGIRLAIGLE